MDTKSFAKTKLNVLLLEDLERDIEIIREMLLDAGFDLHMDCTEKENTFISLLRSRGYDVILADFKLPGFDGFAALRWSREICPDVPFICVSGTIGEEKAVEVLKQGAVDYILKDRMGRLPFSIDRALSEAKDIAERKQAEKTLRESEERYQNLARISPVGIFRTDANGRTTYVNPMWCKIAGLSFSEALGDGWLNAVHPDDRERLRGGWQEASGEHRSSLADYRILRPDGTVSWVMGQATPETNAEGEIVGYIGTITDITERKRAENIIRTSLNEKEILLKEVHHRVKNNLMTIIGLINMQETKAKNKRFNAWMRELEGRVRSMALVHESLHKSENLARIDLEHYIETMSAHIRAQFGAERDIHFQVRAAGVEADLDTAVPCGLILNELITNAFKHAFPGGRPRAGQENLEITVTAEQEGDACTLTVADNGVGLPPGMDMKNPDTLGFQLVRMLSQQLKGSIKVERSHGTVFRVRVPHSPSCG
jgi:PAS domain S-box-containing protein